MVGAAPEHPSAPPFEVRSGSVGVRLARDFPAALQGGVEVPERFFLRSRGAMRSVVGPLEHGRLLGAVVPVARFEHADLRAGEGQNVGGDSASRAGADDHDVVCFGGCFYLGHEFLGLNA